MGREGEKKILCFALPFRCLLTLSIFHSVESADMLRTEFRSFSRLLLPVD